MLYVSGDSTRHEYNAALELEEIILRSWPNIADDSTRQIWIITGVKCYSQQKKDIDILLLANFGAGLTYRPSLPFPNQGQLELPDEVCVKSLCAIIEVKEVLPEQVDVGGQHVQVRYPGSPKPKDVTEQSDEQVYSLKKYITLHGYRSPWVTNFIWLRKMPPEELPRTLHNILGSYFTWEHFLNTMNVLNLRGKKSIAPVLKSASPDVIAQVAELFTGALEPTRLTEQREQEIECERIEPAHQTQARRVARERDQAQAAEDERLRKAEAELLRLSKTWRRRSTEEEGNEEEEKKLSLANSLRLGGKGERLRKDYEEGKILTSQPESQRWAEIAGRYLANKQYKEALDALSRASQINPYSSLYYSDIAYTLIMLGRFQEALDASNYAIQLNPNDSHAFVNRGAALNGLGGYHEAENAFNWAIYLDPNNKFVYRNLAYTLIRLEIFDKALDTSNRAIELNPNDSPAFVNRGVAWEGLGKYQEALKAYKKAEELDPSNTTAKSQREKLERLLKKSICGI